MPASTRPISAPALFASRASCARGGTKSEKDAAELFAMKLAGGSWPERLCEVLRPLFEFRAAGQLSEQPLQRSRIVCREQFLRLSIQQQLPFVDNDDPVANTLHHIQDVRACLQ